MPTVFHPLSSYKSTYLNSRIKSVEHLAERIIMSLGGSVIDIEITCDQLFDDIARAVERYVKHVGYTREYLIFRSDLYEPGWGVNLSRLFSISTEMKENPDTGLSASFDYDLEEERKVLGVFEFNEGVSSGIGQLFTIESTLMNQVFFSPSIGNFGFDVLSWHIAKEYLEMREKCFASKIQYSFEKDSQLLRLFPEPRVGEATYYGMVGCYVEKAFKDCLKEPWVFDYARSLVMETAGFVRGKFQGTTLFGQGTINYNDMLAYGKEEKRRLEDQLEGNKHSDYKGVMFFVG